MPDYVKSYYDAQWWIFFHEGLPVLGIILIIALIKALIEYRHDVDFSDTPINDNPLSITKDH